MSRFPNHLVINFLLSHLFSTDQEIKWRAVSVLGKIVAQSAARDMESAREVMRRLMWSLNDESGSIGWGAPEAMGEIMAEHEGLANEYTHILLSYIKEDGNFLEHHLLQQGVIWGIGRMAQVRPDFVWDAAEDLKPFLLSNDAVIRGTTVWALGFLGAGAMQGEVENILEDNTVIQLYRDYKLVDIAISDLAKQALSRINE